MDYKKIYDAFIESRRVYSSPNDYYEKHHIVMRSLGGNDDKENIVKLTAREHYFAHLLLSKFLPCRQTAFALWAMQWSSSSKQKRTVKRNSKAYECSRKMFSKYITELNQTRVVSLETKMRMSITRKGVKKSEETKRKMKDNWHKSHANIDRSFSKTANWRNAAKERMTDRKISEETLKLMSKPKGESHKQKLRDHLSRINSRVRTEEEREKISTSQKNSRKKCSFCDFESTSCHVTRHINRTHNNV